MTFVATQNATQRSSAFRGFSTTEVDKRLSATDFKSLVYCDCRSTVVDDTKLPPFQAKEVFPGKSLRYLSVGFHNCFVDAFCTNSPLWQVNATVQAVMHSVMMGNDVPKEIWVPMIVIDETNSWSAQQGGGPAAWPRLPHGNWDNWPVLDCTEMGIELPTMEMRKATVGY